jgi:hypothetical protein
LGLGSRPTHTAGEAAERAKPTPGYPLARELTGLAAVSTRPAGLPSSVHPPAAVTQLHSLTERSLALPAPLSRISRASISRFAPSQVTNTSKLVHTFEFVPPPGSFLTVSPLVTTLAPGSVQRVQFDFTPMLSEPEPAVPPPAQVRACPPLLRCEPALHC